MLTFEHRIELASSVTPDVPGTGLFATRSGSDNFNYMLLLGATARFGN